MKGILDLVVVVSCVFHKDYNTIRWIINKHMYDVYNKYKNLPKVSKVCTRRVFSLHNEFITYTAGTKKI